MPVKDDGLKAPPTVLKVDDQDSEEMAEKSSTVADPVLPVSPLVWRLALVFSVLLYSSYTIFVHLCEEDGKLPFKISAVILMIEVTKLLLSLTMFAVGEHRQHNSLGNLCRAFYRELELGRGLPTVEAGRGSASRLSFVELSAIVLPFTVPAVLYTINNNLGVAIQLEMDPATYQVLGNFKILSTAILFRLIIKRPLSRLQWFALLLLLLAGLLHSTGSLVTKTAGLTVSPASLLHITSKGLVMISVYCTISGLSGVYTEYVMKKRAQMNIHIQNALLYIFGVVLNGTVYFFEVYGNDDWWNLVKGFGLWTWLLVITQAFVGMFMGFVMKYANNIIRLFIISSAMLTTTVLAMLVFHLQLHAFFIVSLLLVSTALYLYHL